MKKLSLILALLMLFSGCGKEEKKEEEKIPVISILQIAEHPSLDIIRESAVDELEKAGFKDGETAIIDYKNASNDISVLNTLVGNLSGGKANIVIAIATPTAQAAYKLKDECPVIFSAVSDPVSAGLVKDLSDASENITGTCDRIAVDKILDLAFKFLPSAKKFGMLYNLSEANSASNAEKAKAYAKEHGIEMIEQVVANSSEVKQSLEILADKCDFIFIPNDNTVASAMSSVSKVQTDKKIPIFVGADTMVIDGGLATCGIDYEELGRESARMAAMILKGEKKVSEIPVKVFDENLNYYVNIKTAETLGIVIPEEIKNDSSFKAVE